VEYDFVLTGVSDLLMHADDILASDELKAWRSDSKNKSVSVPGDDRSPAWTWQTYVYHDPETGEVAIPQENVMAALRNGGAKVPYKGQTTFKTFSQSGLLIGSEFCKFTNGGRPIDFAKILAMRGLSFAEQAATCKDKLGFPLSLKRAKIGNAKHVRVRPRFSEWQVSGSISVSEPAITYEKLLDIFTEAGRQSGLGDWRPSSKTPGPFGIFTASVVPKGGSKRRA
jgi:hypothetical protein